MGRLRLLPLLLCVLAAALAAGCGGAGPSAPAVELESLTGVAQRSAGVDTGRFDLQLEMSFPGAPEPFAFGVEGAFDNELGRSEMTIDLSSVVSMIGAFGGALGGDPGASLGDPGDWKLEAILDGTVVYVKVPAFAADKVPGGKPWIKGDLQTLASSAGGSLDLGSLGATDPRQLLEMLEAVGDGLELVGTDEVRGVATTHYRASLDLRKVLESQVGEKAGAALGDLDEMLARTGLGTIPLDVWVDQDQLLRRMDLSFSFSQPGQGEANASMRFELFDVGESFFIELPPAGDVADAATLQPPGP